MIFKFKDAAFVISLVALFSPFDTKAQTSDGTEGQLLEEVVVTAQKREQSIIDVPIAMSVLDAGQLEKTGADSLGKMQQLVPNFSFQPVNGFDNINIRGVGGGGRNIGFDTRAGLYIDGVYIGQSAALAQPLFDIERVEVLRGPQGHLFGRNTVSGAVSLVTRRPSQEFASSFRGVLGSESTREVYATIEGPMGETVFGKISAAYQKRDGFVKNLFDGSDLDDLERKTARLQLRFLTSDKLTIDLNADYSETEVATLVGEPTAQNHPALGPLLNPLINHEERVVSFDTAPGSTNELSGGNLTFSYNLDSGHTLTAITGYRMSDQNRINDTDYSMAPLVFVDYLDESDQFSQEVRIASVSGQKFRYVAGLYYLSEDAKTGRDADLTGLFGSPAPIVATIDSTVDTETFAAFAAVDVDLSESFTLNLGARYTDESKDMDYNQINGLYVYGPPTGLLETRIKDRSENHLKPTIGLTFALNDDTNLYGKYATGFKSGGFNVDYQSAAQMEEMEFDTEEVESFEAGLKGRTGRVSYDLAVFSSKYTDFQILQFVPTASGVLPVIRNAAKVKTKGLEASVMAYISENLRLGANVGLLDAEFGSFPNADAFGNNYSGNELPNAPDLTGSVTVDYHLPLGEFNGGVDFYFEYSHRAGSNTQASNLPKYDLDSRDLVNARIAYSPDDDGWAVSLWANNLFDQDYLDFSGTDFLGTDFIRYGAPRTWGIEAEFRF